MVGYFRLGAERPVSAARMTDLRIYSMAAVKYYDRTGRLAEDLVEDFKETAESTIVPTPVCVSEVGSTAQLADAITANHALTYVRAGSHSTIFSSALRWATQYDSMPTFVSDGPTVEAFPVTVRNFVLGCERFVVGQSLMQANISVSARPGGANLSTVSIFNGRELFRHFHVDGPHFFRTLLLNSDLHKTLVMVVTDKHGNVALANSARSWKAGSNAVIFCGDHTNDCGHGDLLAHGPMYSEIAMYPQLSTDEAGATWDVSFDFSLVHLRLHAIVCIHCIVCLTAHAYIVSCV